jgi:glutamate dehydrogenase/leucine dehydrogenase
LSSNTIFWIPAARPDVLREDSVDRLKARLVLQGANNPATPWAEQRMHEREIPFIPDFITNAGGMISAAIEYRGGSQRAAFDAIAGKIAANTRAMLELTKAQRIGPREAAITLGACPHRAGDEPATLAGMNMSRTHRIGEALNAIDWLNMVQTQWQTKPSP